MAYNAESLTRAIEAAGDATIDYKNTTGANRYTTVTVDFSTPYIQAKMRQRKREFDTNGVLVFSWDMDKFRTIDPSTVTAITPLSAVLKNG